MGEDPYSPPASATASPSGAGAQVWRVGKVLFVEHGAALPQRCVKCNRPEAVRIQRAFTWHPGWVYLLILVGLLVYLIVMLIVRKTSKISIPLCAEHARRRRRALAIAWSLALVGIGGCIAGPSADETWPIAVGSLLLLAGAILGSLGARLVRPSRIDERQTELKGAGEEFLDSLNATPA